MTAVAGIDYDERSGRYRDLRTGRWVPRSAVRAAVDRMIESVAARVQALTAQLRDGRIDLAAWQREMRAAIKDVQILATAAARGGWAEMTPADWGGLGARVKAQYAYLQRFAEQIEAGLPLDGHVVQRAALYAQAGRPTFEAVVTREMAARGYDEVRSVLTKAEHCAGPDNCVEQAAKGWQPIAAYVPIGQRPCGNQDRCIQRFRNSATGAMSA